MRLLPVILMALVGAFVLARPAAAGECSHAYYPGSYSCETPSGFEVSVPEIDFSQPATSVEAHSETGETFVDPGIPEDSAYGRYLYGRQADNANVYAEPSRGAAVVRNVGDGFLYATVNNWQQVNGERWYQINAGEYMHEDDLRLVEASDFRGVVVAQQPPRPFGWIVQDVTPSRVADGEPDESFDELLRHDFFQVYDAVQGEEGWIWYDIGDGRWIRQTYVSLVHVNPRPAGVGPNDFWTEVDLYEQTFAAYEGDRMVYATLISSGLNRWPTREGLFQVWDRLESYKMSGAEGQVDYYYIEDVPYIMYFDDWHGIALHGTFWHDRFGYKHSHGCVNMPILDAEWTYRWSAEAPNDLWVWVHTSDPVENAGL
ncbi:MAG: L,D-transpeptidase [Candidatus Promineifilaceae bacterium]